MPSPRERATLEENLRDIVHVLVVIVEAVGAAIIFAGAVIAVFRFGLEVIRRSSEDFNRSRLFLARFLVLGLEFQLAADLLRTSVAPSFGQIGKLAAIAAIRTGLNFYLHHEIGEEEEQERARRERARTDDRA